MNIAEIKKYMKANKITQIELAKKSGIPLQTLRGIFSGKTQNPRIDTMESIRNALKIESFITAEERNAGAWETKKIILSADEYDLIMAFREIGRNRGADSQKALLAVAEKMQ